MSASFKQYCIDDDATALVIEAFQKAVQYADDEGCDLDGLMTTVGLPDIAVFPLDDDEDWGPDSLEVLLCDDEQVFLQIICSIDRVAEASAELITLRELCLGKAVSDARTAEALERIKRRGMDASPSWTMAPTATR
jgi:hypothetical protein